MSAPIFIGDEISAIGFRSAGVRIRTPAEEDLLAVVEWACNTAPLVMLTPAYAQQLPKAKQEYYLSLAYPPVVIIPDIRTHTPVEDLATRLRAQLGVLE